MIPAPISNLLSAHNVYIARQPIFDAGNRRVAYELLYRDSAHASDSGRVSNEPQYGNTALHAVVSIGLERLAGGTLAFINVTRGHLIGELYKVFDPKTVVLELLETIEGEPAVVEACARAVADGYTLALDDYDGRSSLDVLLPYVKIIKLDVLNRTEAQLAPEVTRLRARGLTVLAERVETGAMRSLCTRLGCELFQGYVFSRPETMDGRAITLEHTTMLSIMGLVRDGSKDDSALEEAFRSHPGLSLALLRLVNSAWIGARSVDSIPYAIRLIGRDTLSRWLLVILMSSVASKSPVANEVVLQAMIRGRFCELMTIYSGTGDPSARFLIGLLSCIDVLLGQTMASVLEQLPLSEDVVNVLLHGTGPHANALALARAYEAGDWSEVDAHQWEAPGTGAALATIFADAVQWANERTASARTS